MKYRREIDGLRAVAVLPVIFFHAGFSPFEGGFVGVDIFFVISGYLITTHILDEKQRSVFSLVRFYERRARRILPALFFIIICCLPFGYAWMFPYQLRDFAQSLLSVVFFSSNILFWLESGYFAAAAGAKPLLHTWSLAVEEQFYVLFPLFILLAWRFKQHRIALITACAGVASLFLAEWASRGHQDANFYLLPTRIWELAIGALAAFYLSGELPLSSKRNEIGGILGLGLIAYAILSFNESTPFPSFRALPPTVGALLVILCAGETTIVKRLLALPPLVGIGLVSYSAYLWHQPLFAFARIRLLDPPSASVFFVLIFASFVLAYLTWRFVELPFRDRQRMALRRLVSTTVVSAASLVVVGLAGFLTGGLPSRFSPDVLSILAYRDNRPLNQGRCMGDAGSYIAPEKACVAGASGGPELVLRGDSHADALFDEIAKHSAPLNLPVRELTYGGCIPARGLRRSDRADTCPAYNEAAQAYIAKNKVGAAIISSRLTMYAEGTRFHNGEGGYEQRSDVSFVPTDYSSADQSRVDAIANSFARDVEDLLSRGVFVVLVYPVPEVGWQVPERLARMHLLGIRGDITTAYSTFRERNARAYRILDALPEIRNLIRIRPEEVFCNTFVENRCVASLNGIPLYVDDNHLDSIGAGMVVDRIFGQLEARGFLKEMAGNSENVPAALAGQTRGAKGMSKEGGSL